MKVGDALSALSAQRHETRLAAYCRLMRIGPGGMFVGELREELGVPPATLTAHLNVPRATNLVQNQREGRLIRVTANFDQVNALLAYLTENCCANAACATAIAPVHRAIRRRQ